MTTYLNIGLARRGQPDLTTVDVEDVLAANLIHTYELELQQSETEQTAVITITSQRPSHEVLVNIAKLLDQDCIAAFDGEFGALLGPNAEAWGSFDLSQFLFPKAKQEFTVEALHRPDRVKVIWEDAKHRYWFYAEFTGDQIDKVVTLADHRFPAVMRLPLGMREAFADYLDAGAPAFAPIILNATRYIRERKLITQAIKARDERLVAQEKARIEESAEDVRNALAQALKESRDLLEALGLPDAHREDRAAITVVQNLPDAFLHRVAALLGCD